MEEYSEIVNSWNHWGQLASFGLTALAVLMLLGYIYGAFDKTSGLFQFNETHHWFSISLGSMGQFMSKYTLGIDGLSISLILLTGLITWVALWNSTEIKEKIFTAQ